MVSTFLLRGGRRCGVGRLVAQFAQRLHVSDVDVHAGSDRPLVQRLHALSPGAGAGAVRTSRHDTRRADQTTVRRVHTAQQVAGQHTELTTSDEHDTQPLLGGNDTFLWLEECCYDNDSKMISPTRSD